MDVQHEQQMCGLFCRMSKKKKECLKTVIKLFFRINIVFKLHINCKKMILQKIGFKYC